MAQGTPTEVVVSGWGGVWDRGLRRAVSDPFTAVTGLPVRHVQHVGLALPDGLVETLQEGREPPFDVVWSNAVAALGAARRGLCDPVGPGRPIAPAYTVWYALVYRRAAFEDGAPDSWRALLDRRHRGRVALYPDGNGIHPVAQVLGGGRVDEIPDAMEPCWDVVEQLRPQVGELDYSIGMEERLQRGELDLCFRALPNALGFQAAGADVGWVLPREGVPDTVDVLWIPRGLPAGRARAARAYVDHALSRRVQAHWAELLCVVPARTDVAAPAALAGAPRVLHVPDAVKFEHQDAWRERFAAIVQRRHGDGTGLADA